MCVMQILLTIIINQGERITWNDPANDKKCSSGKRGLPKNWIIRKDKIRINRVNKWINLIIRSLRRVKNQTRKIILKHSNQF